MLIGDKRGDAAAAARPARTFMAKKFFWATGIALCCFGLSTAYHGSDKLGFGQAWAATLDHAGYNQDYSDATLAKVIPGQTTKAQTEALLGQPWRTTSYGEPGEDEPGNEPPEIWEWRGQDKKIGAYRVHVEFKQDVVTNIAKVPEKTGMAKARIAPSETGTGSDMRTAKAEGGPRPASIPDRSGYERDYSDASLAKLVPGKTTQAEVETLLGQPWRTTNFAKIGEGKPEDEPEVWEWRGQGSENDPYRVHVEFNQQGIVTNVAKISESTGTGPARIVAPPTDASRPPARPR
jgi:outer membrane protein assembly factor BamE (lipoprotein component of BamABCDE complex)